MCKLLYRFKERGNEFRAVYLTDHAKQTNKKLSDQELFDAIFTGSEGKQTRIYEGVPIENIQEALKIASQVLRSVKA